MVEQIRLLSESVGDIKIAWLENKIYVLGNLNRLHVYEDHAPFEKLPGIKTIHDMPYASGMTASASIRSILISDSSREMYLEKFNSHGKN